MWASRRPDVTTYNWRQRHLAGESGFQHPVEVVWLSKTRGRRSIIVIPGRWAHNFASGLQIVPGVAYAIGVGPSRGEQSAFFYLSFEHRFRAETAKN
jgi:hypothetical protein